MYRLIKIKGDSAFILENLFSREEAEYAMAEALLKDNEDTYLIQEGSTIYDHLQKSTSVI